MNAFTVEKNGVLRKRGTYVGGAPGFVMAQVHKDKDMFNIVVSPPFLPKLVSFPNSSICNIDTVALLSHAWTLRPELLSGTALRLCIRVALHLFKQGSSEVVHCSKLSVGRVHRW